MKQPTLQQRIAANRAARTTRSTALVSRNRPSTNLLLRVDQTVPIRQVRISRATKQTAAARCAHTGKRSLWAASQNYRNSVTVDARWSA